MCFSSSLRRLQACAEQILRFHVIYFFSASFLFLFLILENTSQVSEKSPEGPDFIFYNGDLFGLPAEMLYDIKSKP